MGEQCFDDVWFEIDDKETGVVTWHQVRPFIERAKVHFDELLEEMRSAEAARDAYVEKKRLDREEKERQEAERRRKELEEQEAEEG